MDEVCEAGVVEVTSVIPAKEALVVDCDEAWDVESTIFVVVGDADDADDALELSANKLLTIDPNPPSDVELAL